MMELRKQKTTPCNPQITGGGEETAIAHTATRAPSVTSKGVGREVPRLDGKKGSEVY